MEPCQTGHPYTPFRRTQSQASCAFASWKSPLPRRKEKSWTKNDFGFRLALPAQPTKHLGLRNYSSPQLHDLQLCAVGAAIGTESKKSSTPASPLSSGSTSYESIRNLLPTLECKPARSPVNLPQPADSQSVAEVSTAQERCQKLKEQLAEKAERLQETGIVAGGDIPFFCTACSMKLHSVFEAEEHAKSSTHCSRFEKHKVKLHSVGFDAALSQAGVKQIIAIGDCHGGRSLCFLSSLVRSHFFGGSIYSWIMGKREIPPLLSLIGPAALKMSRRWVVVCFSYGEIDCRCHSKQLSGDLSGLARQYVEQVLRYSNDFRKSIRRVKVLPLILAVPPATDQCHDNKLVPVQGSLFDRVAATERLNSALAIACNELSVGFTGTDTWDFAKSESGSLRKDHSDGHVHIDSAQCGEVHERLRKILLMRINLFDAKSSCQEREHESSFDAGVSMHSSFAKQEDVDTS